MSVKTTLSAVRIFLDLRSPFTRTVLQTVERYKAKFTVISCLMHHSVRKPTNANTAGGFTESYVRHK